MTAEEAKSTIVDNLLMKAFQGDEKAPASDEKSP